MNQNILLNMRKKSIARIEKSSLSMERCLHLLDGEAKNIYVMDRGRFTGYAIDRSSCQNSFVTQNKNFAWQPMAVSVAAIKEKAFMDLTHEEQTAHLQRMLVRYPQQEEFPMLDESGEIVSVIEKEREHSSIDWHNSSFPEKLRPYEKIYLSSLGNDNLLGFYLCYRKDVPMEVLSQENMTEAFSGNGIVVFEEDCLPDVKKECLLEAARYQAMLEEQQRKQAEEEARKKREEEERVKREEAEKKRAKEIKKHLPVVRIAPKWASIREDQLLGSSRLIEFFDEGYYSVSIVDAEGRFKYVVYLHEFKQSFPKKNYRIHPEMYVESEDDEESLKWKLAEKLVGTEFQEIPILRDGKIVALGRYSFYFDSEGRWLERQVYRYHWDWIDENVAREFFADRRKILISSEQGYLKGFRERFSQWLDITVYEDSVLAKALAGEYDLMICGMDAYEVLHMGRVVVHQLFTMLLIETVRRWLAERGILLYLFRNDQPVPEIKKRISKLGELIGGEEQWLRDGEQRYFIADRGYGFDQALKKEKRQANLHAGRRCTLEASNDLENCSRIYFYGNCTAIGDGSYSPDKTIESYLQRKLNDKGLKYQVINCGNGGLVDIDGLAINWLYKLMDTPMRCGDVVIVTNIRLAHLYRGGNMEYAPKQIHSLLPPFAAKENLDKKCFWEPHLGHLNVVGQEIAADYIFGIIQKDLRNRNHLDKRKSFSLAHPVPWKDESKLGDWLKKLSFLSPHHDETSGAVILRADPFTKGHLHLLQQAVDSCKHLFVFLVEGEDALLPAENRKKLIESCTKNMPVTLVPALGNCMRDRLSFILAFWRIYTNGVEPFDPVDDTYTFARYIASELNIKMRFFGEEPFDEFKRRYSILKREILTEEGIEYVEIPRMRLPDGRDIITAEVREIWKKDGWRACMDYLPEETAGVLEEQDAAKKGR